MPKHFKRTNNQHIIAPITLVVDNELRVRIEGEKNKKDPSRCDHYMLKPMMLPHAFEITHNAKDTQLEQTIKIRALKETGTEVKLYAYYSDGGMKNRLAEGVHPISIIIVGKISLPEEGTDAGLLTRLLLAEALSPAYESKYGDGKDAIRSMELMREVLDNRITVIRNGGDLARYAGFGDTASVRGVIYPNTRSEQFDGFVNGNITDKIQENISRMVRVANDGTNSDSSTYRHHVQEAIRIANQPHTIRVINSDSLLFWRTAGKGFPVANAIERQIVAHQSFFSLSKNYLQNSKNPQ